MRQIVLDTETTGLEPEQGHRIIEIGAVELVNRRLTGRHFHQYLNPERGIDEGAQEVHGLSAEFLADKPRFAEVVQEFVDFVAGAELIIHNAPFDMAFINSELTLLNGSEHGPLCERLGVGKVAGKRRRRLEALCEVTDSLALARKKHPGQRNSLDALCRRYEVDNSARTLHGALLDAEILADVFLLLTGGQTALFAAGDSERAAAQTESHWQPPAGLVVSGLSDAERKAHAEYLDLLDDSAGTAVWRRFQS
ncbi:MAG: DNA polymerase III subunit epsilon [Pseudomonadales bacterium]